MASISPRKDSDGNLIGYRVQIRRRGHPPQVRTFRQKSEAMIWSRSIEGEMDKGLFVDFSEAERTTLDELLDRYRSDVTPAKRGAAAELSKIAVIKRHPIVRRPVAGITGADLAQYRDDRLREVSPATVNRELTIVSHVFSVAMQEWRIILPRGNPVMAMRRPRTPEGRTRRLGDGEEERILSAASAYERTSKAIRMASIIQLALATGMRRGEISAMRWEFIDFPGRTIHLPDTKNGTARSVPLSKAAVAILQGVVRRNDGWVWGTDMDPHSITRAFDRICARAAINDLRFHDLRHEAVSRLFETTDLSEMEIARITGHKTMAMLSRYTHLRAGHLADRLDGKRRGG
ncbi:site-specific integrase [Acidiphilium sp.]|uniref:site-specific integrase n=1 Tax=Acidiphilium sp. TaxID=527 RepID=UPI003D070755